MARSMLRHHPRSWVCRGILPRRKRSLLSPQCLQLQFPRKGLHRSLGEMETLDVLLANSGHFDRSSIYIFGHRGKNLSEVPPKPELGSLKATYEGFLDAPILKLKDSNTLNAILPGIFAIGAVPQASIDATKPEHFTPIEAFIEAYMLCLK
ncbi:hypothetical protein BDV12DRAFT_196757 [Aspergillus spectabilis]